MKQNGTSVAAQKQAFCMVGDIGAASLNGVAPWPMYGIFLFRGTGSITVDFTEYRFSGNTILFSTPWQLVRVSSAGQPLRVRSLWFHADYYCIEYHKEEVACNGLLFNNIYQQPFIELDDEHYSEIQAVINKLEQELSYADSYSQAVARTYLQLVLALSSKVKMASLTMPGKDRSFHAVLKFKDLLEQRYLKERSPSWYAAQLGMPPNTFSKQCKACFHKSPSALIQERVILEAKKLIHLTHKSMKEIAAALNFADEHYFSRYFKKHTGVAPTAFRDSVGISIAADSSM